MATPWPTAEIIVTSLRLSPKARISSAAMPLAAAHSISRGPLEAPDTITS